MDVAGIFDAWADAGRGKGMEKGHLVTAGPLLDAMRLEGGVRFLDLGCGNGWAARQAAEMGARARGIDASPKMIAQAKAKAGRLPVRYQVGDFQDLPFPDHSFDVVWSMEALYYAPDPDAALFEVKRVLDQGGIFHLLIDYYEENTASHGWPDEVGAPMVLRSGPEWAQSLVVAGFQDVQITRLRDPDGEDWKKTEGTLHVSGRA